jgi:hypothetical protein
MAGCADDIGRRCKLTRTRTLGGPGFAVSLRAPCDGSRNCGGRIVVDVLYAGARSVGTPLSKARNYRRDNKRQRTQPNDKQSPKRPAVINIHCLSFLVDHGINLRAAMERARQICTDSCQDRVKVRPRSAGRCRDSTRTGQRPASCRCSVCATPHTDRVRRTRRQACSDCSSCWCQRRQMMTI